MCVPKVMTGACTGLKVSSRRTHSSSAPLLVRSLSTALTSRWAIPPRVSHSWHTHTNPHVTNENICFRWEQIQCVKHHYTARYPTPNCIFDIITHVVLSFPKLVSAKLANLAITQTVIMRYQYGTCFSNYSNHFHKWNKVVDLVAHLLNVCHL